MMNGLEAALNRHFWRFLAGFTLTFAGVTAGFILLLVFSQNLNIEAAEFAMYVAWALTVAGWFGWLVLQALRAGGEGNAA